MRYGLLALALAALTASPAAAVPINFLVAERPGSEFQLDSYVLPLIDPDDIAHARQLIAQGPDIGQTIVVAHIAAGSDGINRDYLAPGAPLWSWHVTDFIEFADITIEIFDGWPGLVEQDVQGWIDNTGGTIGFWAYTVTAELPSSGPPVPEPSSLALLGVGGLALAGSAWQRRKRAK